MTRGAGLALGAADGRRTTAARRRREAFLRCGALFQLWATTNSVARCARAACSSAANPSPQRQRAQARLRRARHAAPTWRWMQQLTRRIAAMHETDRHGSGAVHFHGACADHIPAQRDCAAQDTQRWLGVECRNSHVPSRPRAETDSLFPVRCISMVHALITYLRSAARAQKASCCASPETASTVRRLACTARDIRRWLRVGGLQLSRGTECAAEREKPLAGVAPFGRV